jgi:hypothetical protein
MRKIFIFGVLMCESIGWLFPVATRAQKDDAAERTADAPAPAPIAYKQLRYDEDWSFLKDKSKRRDYADVLKYISLGKKDWYLSIGGEARLMYESFRNENWSSSPKDDNGWLIERYMLHSDFRLGKKARVFAQIKSGLINKRTGGARPADLDKLDLHQLFFDYKFTGGPDKSMILRAGRQEISFGSSRLVGTREGPNVRQSFDGIRLSSKLNDWTLDGFLVKPVSTEKGFFDDKPQNQQTFGGFYAVSPAGILTKKGRIDFYYLGLDKKSARFNQGAARENRHTVGTRIWKTAAPFDYNFELAYQFGKFGAGRINAWTASSETGYRVKNWFLKPRFGLKADVTSGDKNPNDKNLQTFNALFPRGSYFGQLSPVGPYNHTDLHSSVTVNPNAKISVNLDWINFWRTSRRDGVYNVAGTVIRTGNHSRARFIGQQYALETRWKIDRHAALTVNYSRFNVGKFLQETPPARNTDYFAAWVTYKF